MSGTYTNIAKKRVEQIQEAPVHASDNITVQNILPTTPLSKTIKRKQISAYLTQEQLQKLKSLHFMLNNNLNTDGEIEKSDIVALGIEILSLILGTQIPKYSNIQELKTFVLEKVSKYLSTQVSES